MLINGGVEKLLLASYLCYYELTMNVNKKKTKINMLNESWTILKEQLKTKMDLKFMKPI